MNLYDLMMKRRSVRVFKDREVIVHHEKYHQAEEDQIRQAFDEKYGMIDQNIEKYLERVFVEALEPDK